MFCKEKKPPIDESLLNSPPRYGSWNSKQLKLDISYARAVLLILILFVSFFALTLKHLAIGEQLHFQREKSSRVNTVHLIEETTSLALETTTTKSVPCSKRIIGFYSEFESLHITKTQLEKLTHAVFANVEMSWDGSISFRTWKAKNRFLSLINISKRVKSPMKVMISIGGEENSQYFASVIADLRKRRMCIKSIITFLEDYKIDGVDLYWKHATEKDKFNYLKLLRELRQRMKGNDYVISITLPAAGIENWEMAYDLDLTLEYVDFINVFSMDYYGPWPNQWGNPAGPTAPLYSGIGARKNFNIDWTMQYYVCKARQPSKFNIVVPFFARLWNNVTAAMEPGREAYRRVELTNNRADGSPYMSRWTVEHNGFDLSNATWDEESKSSYIYDSKAQTYLSFETEKSIEAKKDYVVEKNLGGFWIWSVDMDDDRNSLLNALTSDDICSVESEDTVEYKC
ncbi:hypothetical protein GCK72_005175 [Caenorhabditis remanei]|uniref:GH18 domain-containing protein n=1 Tax=Caenorhabditis remanei TaxID=31234 RepID=A0A6A5HFT1_CAERE|nr:hypothetical protein GCK72_005175 [Caenorhabditis remanei]KAF1765223.1 hypothetical protein GCK72_005175 [Caenorhabditis remanei]